MALPITKTQFKKVFNTNRPPQKPLSVTQKCFFSHCYVLEFFLQCPSSPMQCGTLKFRILNVLIPTLLTTLTDLVALFVELSYVQTCSECGLVFILDQHFWRWSSALQWWTQEWTWWHLLGWTAVLSVNFPFSSSHITIHCHHLAIWIIRKLRLGAMMLQ